MVMTPHDRSSGRCGGGITAFIRGKILVAIAIIGCVVVAGCGRRGLSGMVPVEGRVTFAGGECPAAGCVYFLPAGDQPDAATRPRSGWARFERDGRYRATTLIPDDGLLPGVYDVRVDCRAPIEKAAHDQGTSHVPEKLTLPPLIVPAADRGPIRHDIDIVARVGAVSRASSAGVRSHADIH